MSQLGKLTGLDKELASFAQKAKSQFTTDREFDRASFWIPLHDDYIKEREGPLNLIIHNFWEYVAQTDVTGYALPTALVKDKIETGFHGAMPFYRLKRTPGKYSLMSQSVQYVHENTNINCSVLPLEEESSFEGFFDFCVPVIPQSTHYVLACDVGTISKLANFEDPRRVLLDYFDYDVGCIPVNISMIDAKAQGALAFLESVHGKETFAGKGIIGATWYTKMPVPYTEEMLNIISDILPDKHFEVLTRLWNDIGPDDWLTNYKEVKLHYDFLFKVMEEDQEYWQDLTNPEPVNRSARKTIKVKNLPQFAGTEMEPLALFLTNTDMDRIRDLFSNQPDDVEEPQQDQEEIFEAWSGTIPQIVTDEDQDMSWLNQVKSDSEGQPSEADYDGSNAEFTAEELAAMLDDAGYVEGMEYNWDNG